MGQTPITVMGVAEDYGQCQAIFNNKILYYIWNKFYYLVTSFDLRKYRNCEQELELFFGHMDGHTMDGRTDRHTDFYVEMVV